MLFSSAIYWQRTDGAKPSTKNAHTTLCSYASHSLEEILGARKRGLILAAAEKRDGRWLNTELPWKIHTIGASGSKIKRVPLQRWVFGGLGAPVPLARGWRAPNLQDWSLGVQGTWKLFIRKEINLIKALLRHHPGVHPGREGAPKSAWERGCSFNEIFQTFCALIRLFTHFRTRRAGSSCLARGVRGGGGGTSAGPASPFVSSWVALQTAVTEAGSSPPRRRHVGGSGGGLGRRRRRAELPPWVLAPVTCRQPCTLGAEHLTPACCIPPRERLAGKCHSFPSEEHHRITELLRLEKASKITGSPVQER